MNKNFEIKLSIDEATETLHDLNFQRTPKSYIHKVLDLRIYTAKRNLAVYNIIKFWCEQQFDSSWAENKIKSRHDISSYDDIEEFRQNIIKDRTDTIFWDINWCEGKLTWMDSNIGFLSDKQMEEIIEILNEKVKINEI